MLSPARGRTELIAARRCTRRHFARITIPADIRKAMGLAAGERVIFTRLDDGTTLIRAKTRSLIKVKGLLAPLRGKHKVAIEDGHRPQLMPGLDTNVLVRWLLGDNKAQTARVEALVQDARAQGVGFFVPCTVTLELEWVLRSRYRLDKPAVLQAFNALLETRELDFQHEDAVERALCRYRQASADFADCLHQGLCSASGNAPLLTFDERASRLPEAARTGESA